MYQRVDRLQKPYDCYQGFGKASFRMYNLHPQYEDGRSLDPYTLVAQALNALTETFVHGYAFQYSPRFSLDENAYDPFCRLPDHKGTYVGLACYLQELSPCDVAAQSRSEGNNTRKPHSLTSYRANIHHLVENDETLKDHKEKVDAYLDSQPVELSNPPPLIDASLIPDPWSKRGIHWLQTHLLRYLWRETPRFAALVKATAEANGLAKALRVDGQVIGMYVPACNTRGQGIRDGDKERLDGIQWKKERFLPSSHKVERAVPCRPLSEFFAAANVIREKHPNIKTVLLVTSDPDVITASTEHNADGVSPNDASDISKSRRSANYDPSVNMKRRHKWNVLYGLMRPDAAQAGLLQSNRVSGITDVTYEVDLPGNEATRTMVSMALLARCTAYVGVLADVRGQLAYKLMTANKNGQYVPYVSIDQATPQPSFADDRFAVQAKGGMSKGMQVAAANLDMPRSKKFAIADTYSGRRRFSLRRRLLGGGGGDDSVHVSNSYYYTSSSSSSSSSTFSEE